MKAIIKTLIFSFLALQAFSFVTFAGNFQNPLEDSISIGGTANDEIGLKDRFESLGITLGGGEQIRDTIAFIAVKVVIPVFIFAGVIMAIIGFYKLMTSTSEEEQKKAFNFLMWGTLGIILMVSAGYITNQLVGTDGTTNIIGEIGAMTNDKPAGAVMAEQIYVQIFYPFVRIAIFFVLGILFLMAIIHAFKYIFRKDDEFQKKSFTILIYNALGIIVVILAKSMIEIVYGKYENVVNAQVRAGSGEDLGAIGDGVLQEANFLNLQTVVNWMLGLATFIVLILIIYQSYQLLTNPNDEELVTGLKKNIGYTFVGILIIGAGYLLVNFFIIT